MFATPRQTYRCSPFAAATSNEKTLYLRVAICREGSRQRDLKQKGADDGKSKVLSVCGSLMDSLLLSRPKQRTKRECTRGWGGGVVVVVAVRFICHVGCQQFAQAAEGERESVCVYVHRCACM